MYRSTFEGLCSIIGELLPSDESAEYVKDVIAIIHNIFEPRTYDIPSFLTDKKDPKIEALELAKKHLSESNAIKIFDSQFPTLFDTSSTTVMFFNTYPTSTINNKRYIAQLMGILADKFSSVYACKLIKKIMSENIITTTNNLGFRCDLMRSIAVLVSKLSPVHAKDVCNYLEKLLPNPDFCPEKKQRAESLCQILSEDEKEKLNLTHVDSIQQDTKIF